MYVASNNYYRNQLKQTTAFTLIEMMIVMAIIAILTSMAAPRFNIFLLEGRLEEAKPYLMSIAAKEKAYFRRHGTYLPGTAENALESGLGVDLQDSGNFCYMVRTSDFLEQSTTAKFEVWAVLRTATADSVSVYKIGTTCTPSSSKIDGTGWVNSDSTKISGAGRVVVLRYPPKSGIGSTDRSGRTDVKLQWVEGISATDPLI